MTVSSSCPGLLSLQNVVGGRKRGAHARASCSSCPHHDCPHSGQQQGFAFHLVQLTGLPLLNCVQAAEQGRGVATYGNGSKLPY